MSRKIRILSRADVEKALHMPAAIALMKEAFSQLSQGEAVVPVRMNLEMTADSGRALVMPSYSPSLQRLSFKLVSIIDDNATRSLPLIHALVMLFDSSTGRPIALLDGEYLTALRTGAASGLATQLLSREESRTVAIVGAGVQGRFQLQAMCAVREIEKAFILNRSLQKAGRFAEEMSEQLDIPVLVVKSDEMLTDVDIICTATTATTPVFRHAVIANGTHINAVGAYKSTMRELPAETIASARLVVDQRAACLEEAGDIIQAIKDDKITETHIQAELGELAVDAKPGRQSDSEITIFKSVGNAVQDLFVASEILANATAVGLGQLAEL